MLAQFQSLYPNGSLISELVQIFQGKYIVRASVQIEGVTRATGMSAAETVEVAEDQARNRALMVLGMTSSPQEAMVSSQKSISPVQLNPSFNITGGLSESTYSSAKNEGFASVEWSVTGDDNREIDDTHSVGKSDTFSQTISATSYQEPEFDAPIEDLEIMSDNQPENLPFPEIPVSNVTPFTPRSYAPPDNVTTLSGTGKKKKKSEPVDLSDVIAKTDVQIERLGWTRDQGKEYLKKTYGKLGRTLLSEEELLDFLRHLESQPDPIAGF
jgi:hypothetical protein